MSKLFDNLPNKDLIDSYINAYAGFENVTSGDSRASLDRILRFWDEEKQDLYKVLGGNYILEKEITYERPVEDIEDEISRSCGWGGKMREFTQNFYTFADKFRGNGWPYDSWETYSNLNKLISNPALADNKYDGETFSIDTPEGKKLTINTGCKPIRLLAKIAKIFDLEGFEEFRLEHSRILNQKKLKGTLCVSIHPLDYMTMSDNTYGWDSCMNWMNEGQYRQGTVEMMNSPYVVVAYLKGDDHLEFFGDMWNSKKWRNLFIIRDSVICSVKGYPYINTSFDNMVIEWLAELAYKHMGWRYSQTTFVKDDPRNRFDICDPETGEHLAALEFTTDVMYNDFNNSTVISCKLGLNAPFTIYTNYSGQTECMYCGDAIDYSDLDNEGCLVCGNCASFTRCAYCGERLYGDDDTYELDGEYYCRSCWEDRAQFCPLEDDYHHEDNVAYLYLVDEDNKELLISPDLTSSKFNSIWSCRLPIAETYDPNSEYTYWFNNVHTVSASYETYYGDTKYEKYFTITPSDIKEARFDDVQSFYEDYGTLNWDNRSSRYDLWDNYLKNQKK